MLVTMNEILAPAKAGGYGVGFFNAVNVEVARAILETAEELRAPVMIGTAEVLLPAMPLENVADYLIPMAKRAGVPVCVHYDHGLTFDKCMQALQLGFTSVMYDCSTLDYESNVRNVAEMVRICHAMGATVEGELGHVGDNEGAGKLAKPSDFYTDPAVVPESMRGAEPASIEDQVLAYAGRQFPLTRQAVSYSPYSDPTRGDYYNPDGYYPDNYYPGTVYYPTNNYYPDRPGSVTQPDGTGPYPAPVG